MCRIVYIVGRGHSGTTILDCILDNINNVKGCGELAVGLKRIPDLTDNIDKETVRFWEKVKNTAERRGGNLEWDSIVNSQYRQARITTIVWTALSNKEHDDVEKLKQSIEVIYKSVEEISGSKKIIDSSKEVSRALFMLKHIKKTKVIHVVRRPCDVVASHFKRVRHRHGFRFMRRNYQSRIFEPIFVIMAAVSWLVGNILCELLKIKYDDKIITVKYEELCKNPKHVLERICSHLNLNSETLVSKIKKDNDLQIGNQISGNNMLGERKFKLKKSKGGRKKMHWFYFAACKIITYPLSKYYGY